MSDVDNFWQPIAISYHWGRRGNSQWWLSIPQRSSSTSQEPPNKRVQNHQKTSARRRILMTIFMDFLEFFCQSDSGFYYHGMWQMAFENFFSFEKRRGEGGSKQRASGFFKGKCAYNISSCKRGSFSRLLFYYHAHSGGKSLKKFHCRSLSDIIFAL